MYVVDDSNIDMSFSHYELMVVQQALHFILTKRVETIGNKRRLPLRLAEFILYTAIRLHFRRHGLPMISDIDKIVFKKDCIITASIAKFEKYARKHSTFLSLNSEGIICVGAPLLSVEEGELSTFWAKLPEYEYLSIADEESLLEAVNLTLNKSEKDITQDWNSLPERVKFGKTLAEGEVVVADPIDYIFEYDAISKDFTADKLRISSEYYQTTILNDPLRIRGF